MFLMQLLMVWCARDDGTGLRAGWEAMYWPASLMQVLSLLFSLVLCLPVMLSYMGMSQKGVFSKNDL
jgi:hypothetical protein